VFGKFQLYVNCGSRIGIWRAQLENRPVSR
jgi:hypothetical protein